MTKLLEKALSIVQKWPQTRQDDAARILLSMGEDGSVYALSHEERADLETALEEVERGEVATEGEVLSVYRKHGLV